MGLPILITVPRFRKPKSLRTFIALLLVNLAGVAIALVVVEGAARLVGLKSRSVKGGDRSFWRYEELRGWGLRPAYSGRDFRGGPDQGIIHVNAQGFRGPDFARSGGRDSRRILILGDSFAFGVGVDEPHVVSSRLAEAVNADHELTGGNRVDVLNLAVSGYSTDQEVLTFEAEGAPLGPDVVILLMCDNDFDGNLQNFAYSRYYKPRYRLEGPDLRLVDTPAPRAERRRPVRTWLFDNSAFAAALVARLDRRGTKNASVFLAPGFSEPSRESPELLMVALLNKLGREVSRAGAVLVTFNTGHRGEQTPVFQAVRPELQRSGIEHLGLEGPLGEARKRHPELAWDFGSDTHWNVASHDLAATVIHLHLRKLAREGKIHLGR